MDKKIYVITNCGSVEQIIDDEQEMKKRYDVLNKEEERYEVTHYYYGTEVMTRAEFVCNRICGKYEEARRFSAKNSHERLGMTEEDAYHYFCYIWDCTKCPLKEYSPHKPKEKKDETDGNA